MLLVRLELDQLDRVLTHVANVNVDPVRHASIARTHLAIREAAKDHAATVSDSGYWGQRRKLTGIPQERLWARAPSCDANGA